MKLYPFHKIGLLLLVLCSCNVGFAEDQEDEQLTVNATTTDAEGGSSNDIKEANKLAEIFVLQKQLVYKLLQNIGITSDKLSPAVKNAINKPQTTNVKAFKAFCYCLDLMDKGEFKKAREQCDEAVKNDPNFAMAQQLLVSIPDHQETMPEIVSDHMNPPVATELKPSPPKVLVMHNIPPDEPPVQLPSDLAGVDREVKGIDKSSPACNDTGQCGFYSTFWAYRNPDDVKTDSTAPFMNRVPVSISPVNAKDVISINQIGHEGEGFLNLQVDPAHNSGRITAFNDAQLNKGSNIVTNGQLERILLPTPSHKFTGLELGAYWTGFDFPRLTKGNHGSASGLFHGYVYFVEGQPTPLDIVNALGPQRYLFIGNGDFSSKGGPLVRCDGCGRGFALVDYPNEKLNNLVLNYKAPGVVAQITGNNVSLDPYGRFQFDQTSGHFSIGANSQDASSAKGVLVGGPFGPRGESFGGVGAIQNEKMQGIINYGGSSRK